MVLMTSGGDTLFLSTTITNGSTSDSGKFPNYIYGYSDGTVDPAFAAIGSMGSTTYRGATVKAAYSYVPYASVEQGMQIYISGNQPSSFLTGIDYNGSGFAPATYLGYNSSGNFTYWSTSVWADSSGTYSFKLYGQ